MKILFVGLSLLLLIPVISTIIFFISTITSPSPPRPEITRGEFEFRLEYEIDGEIVIIEDTMIAEFAGINHFSVNGKYRRWNLSLASDRRREHLLLLELEDGRRIYYNLAAPGYLMGETVGTRHPNVFDPFNAVFIVERGVNPSRGSRRSVGGPDGLYNQFGIRLISWEHDPPIENRFGDTVIEATFEPGVDFDVALMMQTEFSLGETMDIDGMEITILDDISWGRIHSRHSENDGEYYFYFPIIVTNNSGESNRFPMWRLIIFDPNGQELDDIHWDTVGYNISGVGNILDGETQESYIQVLFAGNGQYTIEFWDSLNSTYLFFKVEFDEYAVPVIQTEFSLGEMFEFEGLEITFEDDILGGTVDAGWSDLDGEHYFVLPITVTNTSDASRRFPWDITVFDPSGSETDDRLTLLFAEDITHSDDILPGATIERYFHILFNGSGEYTIEFDSWRNNITLQVLFTVGEPF